MKRLFLILAMVASVFTYSQNDASKILKQYGFTTETVLSVLDNSKSNYSFKVTGANRTYSEANKTDNTTHRVYSFDNSKQDGQKFSLVTVEGQTPTKKQLKRFNKEKNTVNSDSKMKLSEKDFFVKSDDDNSTIIGFNMQKDELPSKIAFMSHCTGFIHIDKKSGKITKLDIKSKESFNMKIFHVTELITTIDLAFNKEKNIYYITKEIVDTKVLVLGSVTEITIEEEYSDFKFN